MKCGDLKYVFREELRRATNNAKEQKANEEKLENLLFICLFFLFAFFIIEHRLEPFELLYISLCTERT